MAAFRSDKNMNLKEHAKPYKFPVKGPKAGYIGKVKSECGASANTKGKNPWEGRK